jgi:hypothetical protein
MQKAIFYLTILNLIYLFSTMLIDNDANIFTVTMVAPPFFAFLLLIIATISLFFRTQESKVTKYIFIINGLILLLGFVLIRA